MPFQRLIQRTTMTTDIDVLICQIHKVPLVRTLVELGKEILICPMCQKEQSTFLATVDDWIRFRAHNLALVGAMKDILSMIEAIPFKCESLDQLSSFVTQNLSSPPIEKYKGLLNIATTATDLYDNRLGWSEGRNPYAPPEFWDKLGAAIKTYQDLQEKE